MSRARRNGAVATVAALGAVLAALSISVLADGGEGVRAARKPVCSKVVGSTAAAQRAASAARPGKVVCLRDGEYGELRLRAKKSGRAVVVRARHPGKATIEGADIRGTRLTVSRFDIDGEVTIEPGSRHIAIVRNRIRGGYFGLNAGPTTSTPISDTTVRGNLFKGPFGEDAIRINRYHDGPDRNPYGILIEANEITGVRENGNHSDCLQSVWGGDGLYFRRNYLHDNRCQGFFVKDQPEPVSRIVVKNNLMLRNGQPCAPSAPGCGQPVMLQIFGPTQGIRIARNTVWNPRDQSPVALREGPFGSIGIAHNVIFRGWSDWRGGFPNYSEEDDLVCRWEGTLPRLSRSSQRRCHPRFRAPRRDDYRLRHGDRGVNWAPAGQHYGP